MTHDQPATGPEIILVASGDSRLAANQACWPAQQALEEIVTRTFAEQGRRIARGHPVDTALGHGFIDGQARGIEIFRAIDPEAPLIVAESCWQYTSNVLAGLTRHRGPILTLANWSGQWPGLVGLLNLNGSLTKAGIATARSGARTSPTHSPATQLPSGSAPGASSTIGRTRGP